MEYVALENKSALNQIKGNRFLPFRYDLNIYRGCEHGCKYCYAIYSHAYLNDTNYFDTVYYKKNILEALERELSSPKWKHDVINIGGVTDSYQPIESTLKLMPEILKLMIKYKNPIIISTKSTLILRDYDLLQQLAEVASVNIAFTITTMDEAIRRQIEPNAAPSIERFRVLKEFRKTKAILGVHMMPVIPMLTDSQHNLNEIYRLSKLVGADYVLPGILNLRGKTKNYFLNFARNYDLTFYQAILKLYPFGRIDKEYRTSFYQKIDHFEELYRIDRNYQKYIKEEKKTIVQLSLF